MPYCNHLCLFDAENIKFRCQIIQFLLTNDRCRSASKLLFQLQVDQLLPLLTTHCEVSHAVFSLMLFVRQSIFPTLIPNMNLLIFASMAMIGVSSMGMDRKPPSKTAPKDGFHLRNKHRNRYDFQFLKSTNPELVSFVAVNKYGDESIEFSNPLAVTALNKALLLSYYGIKDWKVPDKYLCPPIPSRADYVHHVSDLISSSSNGKYQVNVPYEGRPIRCLDIGTGANAIYPLVGFSEYGWEFIGTDVDKQAIESAERIIAANKDKIGNSIAFRLQNEPTDIFLGVVRPGDKFECSFCNPPFHATVEEARASSNRKWVGLNRKNEITKKVPTLNFGGQGTELVYEHGGEMGFLRKMIRQSAHYSVKTTVLWFTTLVSKDSNLDETYRLLEAADGLVEHRTVEMEHGQKKSRIVAWTFLDEVARQKWFR